MLNSVATPPAAPARRLRLSHDERRRQLLGIGLAKLVEKPIADLSIDEVAAEAGISRSLLFHYFPTKRDFYRACIEAAGRRILRNTRPDPTVPAEQQVASMVRRFVEQIERRRAFYLSLVHGTGAADVPLVEVYDAIWDEATSRVMTALDLAPAARPVVHAWWAYVEDRALTWSGEPRARRTESLGQLVDHGVQALDRLLDLTDRDAGGGPS